MNEPSRVRWLFYAVGTALIGWGATGLITAAHSAPVAWLRFAVTAVILNDGLVAPLIILGGLLIRRFVPGRPRGLIQAGLLVSGAVTLVALPAVLGYGRTADNPSALPLHYGRGLGIVLLVVWIGVGIALGRKSCRRKGLPASSEEEPAGQEPASHK